MHTFARYSAMMRTMCMSHAQVSKAPNALAAWCMSVELDTPGQHSIRISNSCGGVDIAMRIADARDFF